MSQSQQPQGPAGESKQERPRLRHALADDYRHQTEAKADAWREFHARDNADALRRELRAAINALRRDLMLFEMERAKPRSLLVGETIKATHKRRQSFVRSCRRVLEMLPDVANHGLRGARYDLQDVLRRIIEDPRDWRSLEPELRMYLSEAEQMLQPEAPKTPTVDVRTDPRCDWIVKTIRRDGSMTRKLLFTKANAARNRGVANVPSESTMSHELLPAMLNSKPPVLVKHGRHGYGLASPS